MITNKHTCFSMQFQFGQKESLETIQTNDSERVVFLFNQHCRENKLSPLSYYACLILVFILKFNYTYDIPVEVTVEQQMGLLLSFLWSHLRMVLHRLGAVHDGSPPPTYLGGPGAEKCRWEDGYIMSDLRHTEKGFRWSPCSVASFHHFLKLVTFLEIYQVTFFGCKPYLENFLFLNE